jgi:hypothetical protein
MPSGSFAANAAWLTLATIAHNLTRAAGKLASLFHAKARTGTLRRHLITIPARIARRSRPIILRLPHNLTSTTPPPQARSEPPQWNAGQTSSNPLPANHTT